MSDESKFDNLDIHVNKKNNFIDFTDTVESGSGLSFHDTLDHCALSQDYSNEDMDLQLAYNKFFLFV